MDNKQLPVFLQSYYSVLERILVPETFQQNVWTSPNQQYCLEILKGPLRIPSPISKKSYRNTETQVVIEAEGGRYIEIGANRHFICLSLVVDRVSHGASVNSLLDSLLGEVPLYRNLTRQLIACFPKTVRETFFAEKVHDRILIIEKNRNIIDTDFDVVTTTPIASIDDLFDEGTLKKVESQYLKLQSKKRLSTAVNFFQRAAEEKDWINRFFQLFTSLEVLCSEQSLLESEKDARLAQFDAALAILRESKDERAKSALPLLEKLRDKINQLTLYERFKLYTQAHRLSAFDKDAETFDELNRKRNELIHKGLEGITPDGVMVIDSLTEKYVKHELRLLEEA